MGNIVKLKLEEHIRFLLLRYPQNLDRVAEEASNYAGTDVPVSVVNKILVKFKTKQDRDVKYWVACNLAQEVLRQSMSRQAKLEAIYTHWDGKEEPLVSACCEFPVDKHETIEGNIYYRCLKCNNTCNVAKAKNLDLENLKLRLIKDMRLESEHLMKFAKEMGFIAESGEPTSKGDKNYIFVNQQQNNPPLSGIPVESSIAKKAEEMTPMEREKLIHQLTNLAQEATNAEFVEGNKGNESKNE